MWDELRYRWRLRQYLKSRPVVSSSTTNVAGSPDGTRSTATEAAGRYSSRHNRL
jgi:hypothetical protein